MPATNRRLLWHIFPPIFLLAIGSLAALAWLALSSLENFFLDRTRHDLEIRARLMESDVAAMLPQGSEVQLQSLSRSLSAQTQTRITLVAPDGRVIADSHEDPARMENHAGRAEFQDALAGRAGSDVRWSQTLKQRTLYFALPVIEQGKILGAVRAALTLESIDATLKGTRERIYWGGAFLAALAALLSFWISRTLAGPLVRLQEGARVFAAGKLDHEIPVQGPREVAELTASMNRMARELDERVRAVVAQSNERQAVLSSMVEGVIAVDREEKVLSINEAAARLLLISPQEVKGKSLLEVLRNPELQKFLEQTLSSDAPVESEIVLRDGDERFLQVHGSALRGGSQQRIGALLVLNDVTRLRKLETVRRDFVANVSHELKTPITSIKGFVETLLDGAMKDAQEAERFLRIIATQADRLNAIIEDLLQLSRIEQEAEKEEISLEKGKIRPVIEAAVQACAAKAAQRNIRPRIACDDSVSSRINAPLLEQAIVNLLDNAIKYSDDGRSIEISVSLQGEDLRIDVRDEGFGIEKQHLPRIFERFYRVDKSRSRKHGGTGLGLAIVKHIAQAHRGRVEVQSALGKGSVFSIVLPIISS